MTQAHSQSIHPPQSAHPRPLFAVETPPYIHSLYTVNSMMRDTFLALLPAATLAVWTFGLPAFRVMALAASTAVLTEAAWQTLLGQRLRIHDHTAFITGLLFAFLLPAGAPWWLVVTGGALTIILGKQVFGGLGTNPLCPPLIGWALMTVAWPTQMDPAAMNLSITYIEPLARMKYFGYAALPAGGELSLFLGKQLGGLGSAQIAAVLVGGLFLAARKAVRWEIPLALILGVLVIGGLFWRFGASWGVNPALTPPPHLYLLTGSTLFTAFFLATDHSSSPIASAGMVGYGLLAGALLVLIRIFGVYPDGAPFAVLVASLLTPMFDLIRVAPYRQRSEPCAKS